MPTILITGTSKGIGNRCANEFLNQGWVVIGTSTSGENAINHPNYKHFKLDLSKEEEIEFLVQSLDTPLDCLLNNAAVLLGSKKDVKIDFKQLTTTLNVNLIGTMKLTEKITGKLKKGGKVINISSSVSSLNYPEFDAFMANYKISKAAINMYTRILASKSPDLTVIAFDPEWVKTDMGGYDATKEPQEVAKELFYLANAPLETGHFYRGKEKRDW